MTEPHDTTELLEGSDAPGRALAPMFTEGGRPGPGRPPGSPNRTTVIMRTAVAAVFQDLQEHYRGTVGKGEYPHFYAWAKRHPSEFYRIATRQVPMPLEAGAQAIGVVVFKGINDDD